MRKAVVVAVVAILAVSLMPLTDAGARPAGGHITNLPALTPVEHDALSAAFDGGRLNHAEYALHRARSLFRLGAVRREFGAVARPDPHSATLILRDLSLRMNSLSGDERAEGEAILERPTMGGANDGYLEYSVAEATPIDSANFRVHYVTSSGDQSTPAYAAEVSLIMEEVFAKEITAMGWQKPKSDGTTGGNDLFDIYLGNVGGSSLYGYCTTDLGQTAFKRHSYCVLDNGFTEFPAPVTGSLAAKVTAAHEYHHAVQFGYDVTDDAWLMEATATWMEDEVYDTINDNYQYLVANSMSRPQTPADLFTDFSNPSDPNTGFQYGQFIWPRYLSEKFANPAVVREIWEDTAATSSGGGQYSLESIASMLTGRSTDFAASFADFAARNADPSLFYEEGAAYETKIGSPPRNETNTVGTGAPPMSGSFTNVDHLTTRYVSFKPSGVGTTEQISIGVNMGTSPMQKAVVINIANGAMTVQEIPLTNGVGEVTVAFGGQTEVVLALVNASNRMSGCGGSSFFSCGGNGSDDNRAYTWAAALGTDAPDPDDPGGGGDPDPDPGDGPPVISNVIANPSVLRANGRRKTTITFSIDEAATVKVVIVNRSGNKVFGFTDRSSISEAGTYGFNWFGQNNQGRLVPAGKYKVKLTPTDSDGTGATRSVAVTVKR